MVTKPFVGFAGVWEFDASEGADATLGAVLSSGTSSCEIPADKLKSGFAAKSFTAIGLISFKPFGSSVASTVSKPFSFDPDRGAGLIRAAVACAQRVVRT